MVISEDEVRHIAELARLELTSDEVEKFRVELSTIIEYMGQLSQIDTSGISVSEPSGSKDNVLREDRAEGSLPVEDATANASDITNNMFSVPKVVDN
jgi:aspartyl-tRNA(Asn)/glutamyl-tRNA(Gln) amidotransferase subunit C